MRLVYRISPAKYARGRFIVRCPSVQGTLTRAARLAHAYANGRYTNREHGYSLSARQVAQFRACYRRGCDASIFGTIEHTDAV